MTPKEKAKELVDRFYSERSRDDLPLTIYWTSAIGCALICCNEVLGHMGADRGYEFWTSVKQEIESL
jgi:hypothetical protein